MKPQSICLLGYRGTGKTTIGAILAQQLNWHLMEMDFLITMESGKTHDQLTKNGTDWQEFRALEQTIFKEVLETDSIVISTGGGVCVNSVIHTVSGQTFGQENTAELHAALQRNVLPILITTESSTLLERIKQQELEKAATKRPILNEQRAREVQALLDQYKEDPEEQKRILVEAIVEDNKKMYEARQPLYAALTKHVVDTTNIDINDAVEQVSEIIKLETNTN